MSTSNTYLLKLITFINVKTVDSNCTAADHKQQCPER